MRNKTVTIVSPAGDKAVVAEASVESYLARGFKLEGDGGSTTDGEGGATTPAE